MKKLSLVLSLVLFAVSFAIAQRAVSGTITDDGGEPLIGASILVKGTSSGTVTDIDGSYSLEVPDGSTTLVVSYTGFETREVKLGASNVLDITMREGATLDEVVVTGLGIRREKKALGYAVTTLGNEQLELRPEADVARVLRGKVPGVDISQTSGLAGSGTNVIIRGYSSITGSNQPLFVVDGVPFNSDTSSDRGFDEGGSSASSRFLDIDPNNIAEISVLKGLSATVLYGEAGRNGVILITTKNGDISDLNKKFEVTVDQSFFANDIASLPDDQDSWGNGFHNFASAAFSNWGANVNERTANDGVAADGTIRHPYDRAALNGVLPQYVGARYNYQAYDNLQDFFQTGLMASTSVNIANRLSEGTSLNFSYGYRSEEGFIPLSTFDKHNLGLGINTKLANGLELISTFNYVTSERQAPPTGVSFSSNPTGSSLFSNVFYTPRTVDLAGLEYENPQDFSSIGYRGGNDIQNPYWTLNNASDNERISRFFGTIALKYKLTNWLSAMYRVGYDGYTQTQRYSVNKGGGQLPLGLLETSERENRIVDHNLNLQYNTRLSDDLTLDGVVGVNVRSDVRLRTFTNSSQQFVYNLLTHNNFINHTNTSDYRSENLIGAYATVSVGFKNFLYLNAQARNDYTSTLEKENRSILYPSVSASFIATEAFAGLQNNSTLNYLKLRLGYGTSAGYPDPYQTRNILGVSTRDFVTNGGIVVNSNTVDNRFGNPELKPELHSELEFGVEMRLFNNRFGVDLSLYDKQSTDLIIDLDLDPSTGYQNTTINAAEISNKGIELGLDLALVQTSKLRVALNANFTKNVSNVEKLAAGIDQLVFAGYSNLGNFAIVDQPYGVIKGATIARDANGNRIVQSNGTYLTAPDLGILGDPNANYVMNYGINVNFKGIALNALMTYSDGGVIYSTLPSTLMARGILAETDFDRYVPVVAPGVKEDGTPNDIQITSTQHYWQNGGVFQDEMRVYDASFLKLREVSLSYSLPGSVIDNSPFGTVTMTLSGQNLWFKALGFPAGANFDPEVLSLGVGNGRGFELMNVPTSRQIGGSVRLTF